MMIAIKNAPNLPGLIFRHFRGESDHAQIAAVLTESEAADRTDRKVTAADIGEAYQHLNHCDPFTDMIIVEVAGKMIGYARGWWEDETFTGRLYKHNAFLIPAWRRKGVGRAMLMWMEDRLRDIAAAMPTDAKKYFQVNVSQFQAGTAMLVERSGYQPIRYFYEMVRPTLENIIDFPLPDGLELRPVNADQYRAIWKAADENSQDEWGYKESTEADYQEWLTSPNFQPQLWQVPWEAATNQIAGYVLTFIHYAENEQFERKRGYTEGIGVARAWRRRGLARALISRSLQAQKAAGMTESALVADSESASGVTRLYESCGFQIVKRDTLYRKPF